MQGIGSRIFACLVVVLAHLLLWRMLAQMPPLPRKSDSETITITWIDRPRSEAPSSFPKESATRHPDARRALPAHPRRSSSPTATTTLVEIPSPPANAAEILSRAHDWVIANEPIVIPAHDPLKPRKHRLPAASSYWLPSPPPKPTLDDIDRGRRMMDEAGYLADFCPKLWQRISELGKTGDSPELRHELDRLHAYCR